MSDSVRVVRAYVDAVFTAQGMHVDRMDEFIAADCVFHDALPGLEGREGHKNLMRGFAAATTPTGKLEQPLFFGDGDLVAVRWVNTLKHTGELLGVPATGKVFRAVGHDMYRVRNGKIVECWQVIDVAGIMAQLGAS